MAERRAWSKTRIFAAIGILLGVLASIGTIVPFLTGKASLPALLSPKPQQTSTTAPPDDTSPPGPPQITLTSPAPILVPPTATAHSTAPRDPIVDNPNAGAPGNAHTGPLNLQIELGRSGKIGTNTYRSPKEFGWVAKTYDNTGELDEGCYIQWTLYKEGVPIYKETSDCSTNYRTDLDLEPGSYRFVGDITTDWGAIGSGQIEFQVVPGDIVVCRSLTYPLRQARLRSG